MYTTLILDKYYFKNNNLKEKIDVSFAEIRVQCCSEGHDTTDENVMVDTHDIVLSRQPV